MSAYKFRPGQTVTIVRSPNISNARGSFTIVSILPEEHGTHQYRVKSVTDGHLRVVMESEIV
jgi:hypothetical protein